MTEQSKPDIAFLQSLARYGSEAVSTGINRILQLDPTSGEHLDALEGKRLRVDLTGTGQSILVYISDRQLWLSPVSDQAAGEADTVIKGRPGDLFATAAPGWGSSRSGVNIQGDTVLARNLQKLFERLDPDWEAPLTRALGDVAGHQVASFLRAGREWLGTAVQSSVAASQDYLRHESDAMVPTTEFESFSQQVEEIRDAVDRIEARIRRLQQDQA